MDETNLNQFREVTPGGTFALQNSSLSKVRPDGSAVEAQPGSMAAYQGEVRIRVKSDLSFSTFLGRASGGTFRIPFEGPGWVLIQPSEGPTVLPHARQG